MISVSMVSGTIGNANTGKPPASVARSPMRGTLISKPRTTPVTTPIATSGAGISLVTRGVNQIKTMVATINIIVMFSNAPDIHTASPLASWIRNCSSWASPITIANPLTNPSITGYGINRMNLPQRNTPASSCITPINMMVANKYSTP